ncbi:hypothetical protein ACFCV9_26430 [Streptomyces sp. NPDC056367]|uniref:hypothetical protein n=1 Tax=Streptomyces sp. NPDC056367 TaxID=3345797 RepID=UPI0035DA5586
MAKDYEGYARRRQTELHDVAREAPNDAVTDGGRPEAMGHMDRLLRRRRPSE